MLELCKGIAFFFLFSQNNIIVLFMLHCNYLKGLCELLSSLCIRRLIRSLSIHQFENLLWSYVTNWRKTLQEWPLWCPQKWNHHNHEKFLAETLKIDSCDVYDWVQMIYMLVQIIYVRSSAKICIPSSVFLGWNSTNLFLWTGWNC